MRQIVFRLIAAVAAVILLGCSLGTPARFVSSATLKDEAQSAPRLARAAVDEAKVQMAKPVPALPQARAMLDIATAALPESDQPARDIVAGVIADNGKLREAVARAESAKATADNALAAAVAEAGKLRDELDAANRRPLYWVAAIVGGFLIVAGAVVAAFGPQLGIARAPVIGGTLGGFGAASLGSLVALDRVMDSAQVSTALWILVGFLAVAVAYVLWRWIVQGKTLAVAVRETDKLKGAATPDAVSAFETSAGRAMDSAHKAVIRLAREAGAL